MAGHKRWMMRRRIDKARRFLSVFDEKTGFYYRSSIMDKGRDTGKEPFMAEFPEILDIGISGNYSHRMDRGYDPSNREYCPIGLPENQPNMALEDFHSIAEQSRGKVYQFVLSGIEDPDQHNYLEEILKICVGNDIVPNFALSGFGLTEQTACLCKKYCGAAAVRWSRNTYAMQAISMLLDAGVQTNIHYVLGKSTLSEAIDRLESRNFPKGVYAVVFVLDQPEEWEGEENVLNCMNERIRRFFSLVDGKRYPFKIGFDTCFVPELIRYTYGIDFNGIEACAGARWSAYITPDMMLLPCRHGCKSEEWCVNLRLYSIQEAWNSNKFDAFRNLLKSACPKCEDRSVCMGGCPIRRKTALCCSAGRHKRPL